MRRPETCLHGDWGEHRPARVGLRQGDVRDRPTDALGCSGHYCVVSLGSWQSAPRCRRAEARSRRPPGSRGELGQEPQDLGHQGFRGDIDRVVRAPGQLHQDGARDQVRCCACPPGGDDRLEGTAKHEGGNAHSWQLGLDRVPECGAQGRPHPGRSRVENVAGQDRDLQRVLVQEVTQPAGDLPGCGTGVRVDGRPGQNQGGAALRLPGDQLHQHLTAERVAQEHRRAEPVGIQPSRQRGRVLGNVQRRPGVTAEPEPGQVHHVDVVVGRQEPRGGHQVPVGHRESVHQHHRGAPARLGGHPGVNADAVDHGPRAVEAVSGSGGGGGQGVAGSVAPQQQGGEQASAGGAGHRWNSSHRTPVTRTEISRERRHPARPEKKKNMQRHVPNRPDTHARPRRGPSVTVSSRTTGRVPVP